MTTCGMDTHAPWQNSDAVAAYAERTARLVPGLHDLHKMVAILLAERAPDDAQVLVVGAGGGMELRRFAQTQPQWRFVGVDPSKAMLDLALATLDSFAPQVSLHHGYVDMAPAGPFDAASCLLTMHFLNNDERRSLLREIHRRLKPGAPLVLAHLSFPQGPTDQQLWLSRYVAFAVASGVDPQYAAQAAAAIASRLTLLSPEDEEALLVEAGFDNAKIFYAGMAFRGWVAYRDAPAGSP